METLQTDEVRLMVENHDGTPLINVLSEEHFKQAHIPDSTNIPLDRDDFVERVVQQAGGKDQRVVVYCASERCDASSKAAQRLLAEGFTDVADYEGGTRAWKSAGLKVEGEPV